MTDKIIEQVISHYFNDEIYDVHTGASGMNNMTRYIKTKEQNYVLRIYKNHADIETIAFEHELLTRLVDEKKSFQTPQIVKTKENTTYVLTQDGEIAVLFRYLPGHNFKLLTPEQYKNYGTVLGELSSTLNKIKPTTTISYPPYYELDKAYPTCTIEKAVTFCENHPEDFKNISLDLIKVKQYLLTYQNIQEEVEKLPHQLIHGDINCSNLLMNEAGKINAVLDFEFVTFDLRVMELAICLSELLHDMDLSKISDQAHVDKIHTFIQGYLEFVRLTPGEIEALPKLIVLRRVDVFLHFINRYLQGIETEGINSVVFIEELTKSLLRQAQWIEKNESILKAAFVNK